MSRKVGGIAQDPGESYFPRNGKGKRAAGISKELTANMKPLSQTPPLVQRKISAGAPGDRYEAEADTTAKKVMGKSDPKPGKVSISSLDPAAAGLDVPPIVDDVLRLPGRPLDDGMRAFMEPRFGHDFGRVRIYDDSRAEESADLLQARAYTVGNSIVFGKGQYTRGSGGTNLLAHELTHVIQQQSLNSRASDNMSERSSSLIQGSFWGDLWEGIKSVGRSISRAVSGAARWTGERFRDLGQWVVNLFRDLPERLARFGEAIVDGLRGVVTFIPEAIGALARGGIRGFASWLWERVRAGAAWVLTVVARVFDLVGGPELIEFIDHLVAGASPLTAAERAAGQSVLGANAIRWDNVRIAEGGLLALIFRLNSGRAFTTFHTINMPASGYGSRADLSIVVHELAHVYQYERVGSVYLGQAIHAQMTIGYGYGGGAGLSADRVAGKHYRDYNREQQAQIAQDYYTLNSSGQPTADYDPFIAELRAGDL